MEYGEIGLDFFMSDQIEKIPVLGTLGTIFQTIGTVSDFRLARKLLTFLEELSSLSQEERDALILKLESDQRYEYKIGEMVLI